MAKARDEQAVAKCTERLALDASEFRKLEREARRIEAKLARVVGGQ